MRRAGRDEKRRKKRGWLALGYGILLLLLMTAAVYYYIEINDSGYVRSHLWLARRYAARESEEQRDKARSLYEAVLERAPEEWSVYLEAAAWEEAWASKHTAEAERYERAYRWLAAGAAATGQARELMEELTRVARLRIEGSLQEGDWTAALERAAEAERDGVEETALHPQYLTAYLLEIGELLEAGDVPGAIERIEALAPAYQEEEELLALWRDAYLMRGRELLNGGYAAGAVRLFAGAPQLLWSDTQISELWAEAYLALARQSLLAGDEIAALDAAWRVLALSPEEPEALALIERLTAVPTVDAVTIEGSLTLELRVDAMFLTIPAELSAPFSFTLRELTGERPELSARIELEITAAGREQARETLSDTLYGTGDAEAITQLKNAYLALAARALPTGEQTVVNGIPCEVSRYTLGRGDLSELAETLGASFGAGEEELTGLRELLPLIGAEVTRYVSLESGELLRIDAELAAADLSQAAALFADELPAGAGLSCEGGRLSAEISGIVRK